MSNISSMRNISVANYFLHAVLRNAAEKGLDPAQLLHEAGISAELLKQQNARIPAVKFGKLQAITMRAMKDEFLGYGPGRYLPGTWTNMCYSLINCATLGHALARYCRFYQMFEWGLQPRFEINGDEARLILDRGDPNYPYGIYAFELIMFNLHRFSSWFTQQHLPLIAVNLEYSAPDHAEEYRHLFLGQAIYFDKPQTELVFHRSLTELPAKQTEQSLHRFLQHPILVFLIQQYKEKSWTAQVRIIINKNLVNTPGIDEIAEQLNLHPQTLRRRLAQEGSTFNEVKTQCRHDTALYYLGKSKLSIESIAQRTGFSEASAFTRAFKTWTGMTPQHYRQQL
ncbi:AraC family transcriptional regulator [Zhongshania guokunii]|uniref:AraC family transcriptional regulator n=1 Tax=Zhongshania guokunii TaxID=641783 RepID=A0ABV3U7J5_9GAMM